MVRIFILLSVLVRFLSAEEYIDFSQPEATLHEHYRYLEDKKGELTFDSVLLEDNQKTFHPLKGRSAGFGLTKSDFWIKLSLENSQKYPIKRLLKFDYPLLDNVAFYRINPDGTYFKKISGD